MRGEPNPPLSQWPPQAHLTSTHRTTHAEPSSPPQLPWLLLLPSRLRRRRLMADWPRYLTRRCPSVRHPSCLQEHSPPSTLPSTARPANCVCRLAPMACFVLPPVSTASCSPSSPMSVATAAPSAPAALRCAPQEPSNPSPVRRSPLLRWDMPYGFVRTVSSSPMMSTAATASVIAPQELSRWYPPTRAIPAHAASLSSMWSAASAAVPVRTYVRHVPIVPSM